MGYRKVNEELLWNVYARLRTGDSNRKIAATLKLDRKTVDHYVERLGDLSLPLGLSYIELLERLQTIVPSNAKPKPATTLLAPFANEIRLLIAGDNEKGKPRMKAKTAWEVISHKYELTGKASYATFKRFVCEHSLSETRIIAVPRLETDPGEEVQIDYGKAGMKSFASRRRAIHAYCGILSCSRHPFVQFVLSQDTVSFTQSTADMFSYYGGATRRINLDNLKAGVLTADIYDPTLNRTFAELCEHYGVIADPARAASPKDKGKIERFVQVARELFLRLDALYPEASLDELNKHALAWCRDEYGKKKHGTTGIPPRTAFEEIEQPCLLPLPAEPFVPARWTTAKVHPDQFIQTNGKQYGLPVTFIGAKVAIRTTASLVSIYHNNRFVRQYPVTNKRRDYLSSDFPQYAQPFSAGSYASFLEGKAELLGPQAAQLIKAMLESGGNLAIRQAQGCMSIIEAHRFDHGLSHVLGKAIAEHVYNPRRLKVLFEADACQNLLVFPLSETGKAMARTADYYTGP